MKTILVGRDLKPIDTGSNISDKSSSMEHKSVKTMIKTFEGAAKQTDKTLVGL